MVGITKRFVGGFGVLAVSAASVLAFAPQATAGTTNGTATCTFPPFVAQILKKDKVSGPMSITVTGPATAKAGTTVSLDVELGASPATSPAAVPVEMTPTMEFKAAGASTATLSANGKTFSMNLPTNEAIKLPKFKADLKIPADAKAGKLELTPTKTVMGAKAAGQDMSIPCTNAGTSSVLSIDVTAAAGATTGDATTGNATTGNATTGNATTAGAEEDKLPKTGPLDDAQSLGLIGGSVALLGVGGVLFATRRARSNRAA